MKIDEIMFSDKELAIAAAGKKNDVLKPSDKNTGRYGGIDSDTREKLRADTKEQTKEKLKMDAMMKKIKPPPSYLTQKEKEKWINSRLAILKREEEAKRIKKQKDASQKKIDKKQSDLNKDIASINAVKPSQPLPDNPENEKRKLPSDARRRNMDRYWAKYKD